MRNAVDKAQEWVDGHVILKIGRGNIVVVSRDSPFSRYSQTLASMDEAGDYNPAGMIKHFLQLYRPLAHLL